jgi:hypothetical protein
MLHQVDDPGYCPHFHQQLPVTTAVFECQHTVSFWDMEGTLRCAACGKVKQL